MLECQKLINGRLDPYGIIIVTLFCQKNKNIIFNNTTEIQLAGRQKNIKFMKAGTHVIHNTTKLVRKRVIM